LVELRGFTHPYIIYTLYRSLSYCVAIAGTFYWREHSAIIAVPLSADKSMEPENLQLCFVLLAAAVVLFAYLSS
jgi:hypothetical protein